MQFIRPKDFQRYTHYRDRNPTWIKLILHDVLDDNDFLILPDAAKGHVLSILALYARTRKPIPADPKILQQRIGALSKISIPALAKWVEYCDKDATEPLAEPERPASNPLAQNRIEENRVEEKREEEPTVPVPTRRKSPVRTESADGSALWGKPPIRLDPAKWEWLGISEAQRSAWKRAYPVFADDATLDAELVAALNWCVNSGARGKKSNYGKFLGGWLGRSQERGGPGRYNAVMEPEPAESTMPKIVREEDMSPEQLAALHRHRESLSGVRVP